MRRLLYRVGADIVWSLHFLTVCVVLFGWTLARIWPVYVAALIGVLISTLACGYCVLSKVEFELRKRSDPAIDYDFSYASFYTYRLTRGYLSNKFLAYGGVVFAALSLGITLYFHYLYSA